MMLRLFFAIEFSQYVKDSLANQCRTLARATPDVRWTAPENLHLTLRFVGEVNRDFLPALEEVGNAAMAGVPSFELSIEGFGCFPSGGRGVRIIWIGANAQPLAPLVERLEQGLRAIGCPPDEKPFAGHVTLGRIREDRSKGKLRKTVEEFEIGNRMQLRQHVEAVVVLQSTLRPAGPVYSPLTAFPLESPPW